MRNLSRWPALFAIALLLGMSFVTLGRSSAVAQDEVTQKLIVYADTVQGGKNITEDQAPIRTCVLNSRFPRNGQVVWRIRVIDPKTGEQMDDTMLDKVVVTIQDGQTFDMAFHPHPPPPNPPRDYYWAGAWLIPSDYPTGTFTYTITATAKDGRTGEFKPFDIPSSLPTVTDEVLATIEEEED